MAEADGRAQASGGRAELAATQLAAAEEQAADAVAAQAACESAVRQITQSKLAGAEEQVLT